MLRHFFLWITLLAALGCVERLQAQSNWTAHLFSPQTGTVTQIGGGGEVVSEFTLPLTQAFNAYGRDAVMSSTGRYIAYTAFDSTVDRPNTQLFVYDRSVGSTRFGYDITGVQAVSFAYNATSSAFDEARQQFAFGYRTEDGWEVVVGDFNTALPVATLSTTANSAATPELNALQKEPNILPLVQRYDGTTVTFTAEYSAYRWNISTGEVAAGGAFTSSTGAIDPATGQIVGVSFADSTEPNAIDVTSAAGESTRLYLQPEGRIERVLFIEAGARILAERYLFETEQTSLIVLNRDGTIANELVGTLDDLTGTPDGFIGVFESGGSPALAHVSTTQETLMPTTLWSGAAGTTVSLLGVVIP